MAPMAAGIKDAQSTPAAPVAPAPIGGAGYTAGRLLTFRATGDGTQLVDLRLPPCADDGSRRRKHFTHARSTLWPLVTDHDDVSRIDPGREYCLQT